MKKFVALGLGLILSLSLVACGGNDNATTDSADASAATETVASDPSVMSHADFIAAAIDSEVTIETYVQAHQSWWDNTINVYAGDFDGGYYIYNMACSEEDAAKLTEGTKIRVKGFKSEWSGEIEITDATFEFVEAEPLVVDPINLTDLFADASLSEYMNMKFYVENYTILPSTDADGMEVPFLYGWDGSGSHDSNSDLYFRVADPSGNEFTFTVESYLCDNTTDVYAKVEGLNIGDTVNLGGFLYWYNGANPHINGVIVNN